MLYPISTFVPKGVTVWGGPVILPPSMPEMMKLSERKLLCVPFTFVAGGVPGGQVKLWKRVCPGPAKGRGEAGISGWPPCPPPPPAPARKNAGGTTTRLSYFMLWLSLCAGKIIRSCKWNSSMCIEGILAITPGSSAMRCHKKRMLRSCLCTLLGGTKLNLNIPWVICLSSVHLSVHLYLGLVIWRIETGQWKE